jgi:hypothetical protein
LAVLVLRDSDPSGLHLPGGVLPRLRDAVDLDVAKFAGIADAVERADEIARPDRSAWLGGENEPVVLPGTAELLTSAAWAWRLRSTIL